MNIILISQSTGKGATTSRKILDRFATRYGTDTWMTSITSDGLQSLKSDLKNNSSKSMSVGCYRAVGSNGRQLMWVVGSRKGYSVDGQVAIATRSRQEETHVEYRAIQLLARLAGFSHDLGKINAFFQEKIRSKDGGKLPDPARHEYLSVRLLDAIVSGANVQLDRKTGSDAANYLKAFSTELKNNEAIDAVKWVVLTHHAMPSGPSDNTISTKSLKPDNHVRVNTETAYDPLKRFNQAQREKLSKTFNAKNGFIHYKDAKLSEKLITKIRSELKELESYAIDWRGASIIARASMMMADHCVSARKPKEGVPEPVLMANSVARQELNEHLFTVGALAYTFAKRFMNPDLDGCSLETLDSISAPSAVDSRFNWQNIGADFLGSHSGSASLVFNMAATGTGKTRANMRFLYAMRDTDAAFRVTSVFNLRSLTVQTGRAYRDELGIDVNDMNTVIGDALAVKMDDDTLNQHRDVAEDDDSLATDTDVQNSLLSDYEFVGPDFQKPYWLPDTEKNGAKLLAPPILVSTIDYISAAADFSEMGKNALAMMRVASSDLIIDEIDGYDPLALVAVSRLLILCGLFNRHVVVSSATISEPVAKVVQESFSFGVQLRNGMLNTELKEKFFFISDNVEPKYTNPDAFDSEYGAYANSIVNAVSQCEPKRMAKITPVPDCTNDTESVISTYCDLVNAESKELHQNHHVIFNTDTYGELRVSIGLIRVANVRTCVELSRKLVAKKGVIVTAYHASDMKLRRAMKEKALNSILKRPNENRHNAGFLQHPDIKRAIDISQLEKNPPKDIRFIVVATPVEEVGADHDFDWAIIEPSSAQSIVQTAGRVNRHRLITVSHPNVVILDRNVKYYTNKKLSACFIHPGYEQQYSESYKDHSMYALLSGYGLTHLHSGMRIGDNRTPFAVADDQSIALELSNGADVHSRNETQQSGIMHSIYLWNTDYLRKYSMRNHTSVIQPTQLIIDDHRTLKYYNGKLNIEDMTTYGDNQFEKVIPHERDIERTFLCYSREDVEKYAEYIDENVYSALSFTVHTFTDQDIIVFDPEFGAYRKNP